MRNGKPSGVGARTTSVDIVARFPFLFAQAERLRSQAFSTLGAGKGPSIILYWLNAVRCISPMLERGPNQTFVVRGVDCNVHPDKANQRVAGCRTANPMNETILL